MTTAELELETKLAATVGSSTTMKALGGSHERSLANDKPSVDAMKPFGDICLGGQRRNEKGRNSLESTRRKLQYQNLHQP